MTLNVGTIDRVLRVIVGLALLAFAIPIGFPHTGWNWVGWIGVVPLLTGVFGYCPAYSLFGMSNCPKKAGASRFFYSQPKASQSNQSPA